MDYQEFSDSELFSLIGECNEDAKELLYGKYKYLIDVLIKKYVYKQRNWELNIMIYIKKD